MRRPKLMVCLMSWLFMTTAGCSDDQYVQTNCTVTDRYTSIWMTLNGSDAKDVAHQSFVFAAKGVTFRVKPVYYAQDWSQIAEINFHEQSNPDVGLFSFRLLEKDGSHFIQPGGIITKGCWARIGEFLEKNEVEVKLVTE